MSSPLKNVSVEDVEKAIAEALSKLCEEKKGLTASIGEMKFNASSGSVALSLTVHKNWDPSDSVFGGF